MAAKHDDFDALRCPFDNEDRLNRIGPDRLGVLFKTDWRTEREAEKEYGEHGPIFVASGKFPRWGEAERREFFDYCKAYAPFMIQFCKSVTDLTVMWMDGGKSEFFRATREKAYPTEGYTKIKSGDFDFEEISTSITSESFRAPKSTAEGVMKAVVGERGKGTRRRETPIKLLHGWTTVHGTTMDKTAMDPEKTLTSWKMPEIEAFHTHGEFDCPFCPMKGQDGWVPDRTSVVHMHMPLDSIDGDLRQLQSSGQTLLHSVLPLGVVSPNRFMVSADFYVDEGRQALESQGDKGKWNTCNALTAFWLHSKLLSELVHGLKEGVIEPTDPEELEAAILQALPADTKNWFPSAMGMSQDGFPDGSDLVGSGGRSGLYYDLSLEEWILDTEGRFCSPQGILIPTNKDHAYDDDIKSVLEELGLHVMRRDTYDHILSTGSYVLDDLRELIRKRRMYDPGLPDDTVSDMLEKVRESNLDGLEIGPQTALARLVLHHDSEFDGEAFPDEEGVMRTPAEFRAVPKRLSVLEEIQGERPVLHPDIEGLLNPGETTVEDALKYLERRQQHPRWEKRNLVDDPSLLDELTRLADQILSDRDLTTEHKIRYDFIPCKFGEVAFLRGDQHLVRCECGQLNPPLIQDSATCLDSECSLELRRGDREKRVAWDIRAENRSRNHIFSPEQEDIPDVVAERIVTACSGEHFSDKLVEQTKVGLIRYLGYRATKRKKVACQNSLFEEGALKDWLNLDGAEHDEEDVLACRLTFLEEIKQYIKAGKYTEMAGFFTDSPVLFDEQNVWAPAKEFILNIDDVTLGMLRGAGENIRTPHPDLLDPTPIENEWMAVSELGGAKKNVEFRHLERAIRGILGESLTRFVEEPEDNCRNLAKIASFLLKHEELLEEQSEGFDSLEWLPIGLQDGFEQESDRLCMWSEFPLPGPGFDSVWGKERDNPHITHDGEHVSPHMYFEDEDLGWMRTRMEEDPSWATTVGMKAEPSAERMFLVLVTDDNPEAESVPEGLYGLLSQLNEVPKTYWRPPQGDNVHRFFNPRSGVWHEGVDCNTLLVETSAQAELIGGSCIPIKGLSPKAEQVLDRLLQCETVEGPAGSSEAISRISLRWEGLSPKEKRGGVELLKGLWNTFHEIKGGVGTVRCWKNREASVRFPLGQEAIAVDSVAISPQNSSLHHFVGQQSGVHTSDELAQKEDGDLRLHRSELEGALSRNGALDWNDLMTGEWFTEGTVSAISRLKDRLGLSKGEVDHEDAYAWGGAMLELEGWYSAEGWSTRVPFPHWREGSLVVDKAYGNRVYFAPAGSNHSDKIEDFRENGLWLLHIRPDDEKSIHGIEGRTEEDGPFPGFDANMDSENVGLGPADRDEFAPLGDYIGDLQTAIEHRFVSPIEGDNPLRFLGELTKGYRTPKRLEQQWKIGEVKVTRGSGHWTIDQIFSDPPVWPQVEVTYRTDTPERRRESLIRQVLQEGLWQRLDKPPRKKEEEGDESSRARKERKSLARALGREGEVYSADIIAIVSGLLPHANPLNWVEVDGFGGIWDDTPPRLSSDLILNPDVQAARERILAWYNDVGCQLCGQLTPDGPGSTAHEETRAQIFKSKQTKYIWHSATEQGGDVGNWLYLCPTHFRSLSKKCLHLSVLVDDEEVELEELVDRAKEDRGVLSNISDDRIYADVYERRGGSEDVPWEDSDDTGAVWSENREIRRMKDEHVHKIVEKVKAYVLHKLG